MSSFRGYYIIKKSVFGTLLSVEVSSFQRTGMEWFHCSTALYSAKLSKKYAQGLKKLTFLSSVRPGL